MHQNEPNQMLYVNLYHIIQIFQNTYFNSAKNTFNIIEIDICIYCGKVTIILRFLVKYVGKLMNCCFVNYFNSTYSTMIANSCTNKTLPLQK